MRVIHLPAIDRTVSIATYLRAIRLAKAHPERVFNAGLSTWWPTTGKEIMEQFEDRKFKRGSQGMPVSH